MLIQPQNINVNDIVTFKLVSGEEIIGKVMELGHDSLTLAKPLMVMLRPMSADQVTLSFLPVLGSTDPDQQLTFMKTALSIRPTKAGKNVASNYTEMTSGLITPRSGLVT